MKRILQIIFLALISSSLLLISAESKNIDVVRANPQGIEKYKGNYSAITVSFSEQMVELSKVKDITEKYFTFNIGDVLGKYEWLDTKTIKFTPSKQLPIATAINVTVKKGIKSLSGKTLAKDYKFSFTTVVPSVKSVYPYNNQTERSTKEKIYVNFNMPISMKNITDKIEITENGKSIKYKIKYATKKELEKANRSRYSYDYYDEEYYDEEESVSSESRENKTLYNNLIISPVNEWQKDANIVINFKKGILPLEGNVGAQTERVYTFTTHKTFYYTGKTEQEVNADFSPKAPEINFSTKVRISDLYKNIEIEPKIQMPDEDEIGSWNTRSISLYLNFNPETKYKVTVKKGLTDIYGQKLENDVVLNLYVASYNPNYDIPTGTGVVEAYEGRKLPLTVINPNPIEISSKYISKDEIIPYLIMNGAVYNTSSSVKESYERKYAALSYYDQTSILKPDVKKNKYETVALYLDKYMGKNKYGLVSLRLNSEVGYSAWDKDGDIYIQVTDMGVTGKFSAESNTIFVSELKTGKPVANANVEIRDDYNNILAKAKTDKSGIATTDGWYNLKIKQSSRWESPRQWVIVTKGNDIAYIHSSWGTGVDPWRMNINYSYSQQYPQISGTMTTERGLYKPGEDIHIKGVIRENINGGWEVPKNIRENISYIITDSRGNEFYKGQAKINEYGTFVIDTKTSKDAPTGFYNIRADYGDYNMYLDFRVQVFKTLEFETKLWAEDKEYILGDSMPIRISGKYLFGEVMPKKPLSYDISINENYYEVPNNTGFRFTPLRWYEDDYYPDYNETLASGSGMLDDKGEYAINPLITADKAIHSAMVNIEATVEGEDSQRVSARKSVLVFGSEFYFGIRKTGYFIEKGKPATFDIISAKPNGDRTIGEKGEITVKRIYWESVRKAVSGGRMQWFSEKVIEEVAKQNITTTKDPVSYTFVPEKTGLYIISIEGKDGRKNKVLSEEYVYAIGEGYSPWAMYDDDLLELVAEKENYKPGENARIMLKSPYEEATAFVTVERDFVMESFVTNVKGTSALIEVPIKSEYLPNAYVGVVLIKGRVEDKSYTNYATDLGKPSFKIGYANINVSPTEKELKVKIDKSHAEREPGDKMSIGINVSKKDGTPIKSELMIAVCDVGVLNLIGFKTPNWFNYFYGTRSLGVKTADTRLHIIGQRNYGEKGQNAGGGGMDSEMDANLKAMAEAMGMDVFSFRKNFLSTAFYAAQVETDEKGNARVEFNLPDNITTFRIMATAVDKTGYFGANDDIVVVKKNLMLMPTLPEFAVIDDKFTAGATVYNYAGKDLEIKVMATGENIDIENPIRTVNVKGGSFEDIRFNFTAKNAGDVKIRIAAKGGDYTDAVEKTMKVTTPRVSEAVAIYESTTEKSVTTKVNIPSKTEVYSGGITGYLSPSAFSELSGGIDYLIQYPYGCLEQKMSKIYPIVMSKRLIVDMKLTEYTEAYLDSLVNVVLKEVIDCQSDNGGFSYWVNKTYVSPWLTSYATFVMLKAKDNGYNVNTASLDKALEYLQGYVKGKYDKSPLYSASYVQNAELAFIASVLARGGKADRTLINNLYKNRNDIPFYGLANLLTAMHYAKMDKKSIDNVRMLMMNTLKEDPNTAHYETEERYYDMLYIHSSAVRDTAIGLTAFLEAGYDDKINDKIIRWLTQTRVNGAYANTQDNVSVFYAMNEYFKKYENIEPKYKAELMLMGKTLLEKTFNSRTDNSITKTYNMFDIGEGSTELIAKREGEGRLYYGMSMKYAPKGELKARDNGIKVEKKYLDMNGKEIKDGKFIQGKDYKVVLNVTMPYTRNFVIVDDPVPAGMRVLDVTFDTESSQVKENTGNSSRGGYWWYGSFNYSENYGDKVILYGDVVEKGTHTYTYIVRAATPGEYTLVNTKAEEMYNPEVFGYSEQKKLSVLPK